MVTPSSSSSSAEAANAIFGKWREYALALHNWLKSVRAEAEPRSVHGSRTAQRKTHYRKLWNELTSMVGNCDVETAEMALQRITECRESAQHDIDQIEAQIGVGLAAATRRGGRRGLDYSVLGGAFKEKQVCKSSSIRSCNYDLTPLTHKVHCRRSRRDHCRIVTRGTSVADGAAGCRRSGGGVPVNDSAVVKTPLRFNHGARTWRALKDGVADCLPN